MSLYDKASLIQVPSLYKDGLLVSTVPEDRSGDFTFSRGSNLSATRINEQGYIEKGYENLLLQSNSFDTTWANINSTETSGQQGYDGSNDAWLLEKSAANGFIYQSISTSGVQALSIYAKQNSANSIRFLVLASGGSAEADYNLSTGVVDSTSPGIIGSANIEDVGNGWYRCSFSVSFSLTTQLRIYPVENGSTSASSGSVYIQDAMLNQGLVSYPYIETTTAPVAGGILEDMPRLDWSGSCPSLLLEPSRTNLLTYSEYYNGWTQSGTTLTTNTTETLSPEGLYNASKLVGNGTTGVINSGIAKTGSVAISVYLKSVSGSVNVTFKDPYGGLANEVKSVTTEWQRFDFIGDNGASFAGFWIDDIPASGIYMWGAQLEQDATYPTSYIPTYGVSQTRLRDIQSELTIPNGNVSEGTIFYEFDKAQAPNSFDITPLQIGSVRVLSIQQYNPNMRFDINNNAANYNEPNSYNSHIKVAASYVGSVVKLFINGDLRATDNTYSGSGSVVVPENGLQKTQIGCSIESKQLLYFPTALSDSECIALTTIT